MYTASERQLERALGYFPGGGQTSMKSAISYPLGVAPLFAQRGEGSRVWDVDGNEYIDFVNGLGAITLGYNDPDVREAVVSQLDKGTIFSLSHPIELELAELLREIIPCCEMLRFGKNGSDMTTTAVRLARAYTNRERVAICGYHGWHDWSIAATPLNAGVPKAVRELTHSFKYNDFAPLEFLFDKYPGEIAAVIMEPMRMEYPRDGFLEKIREICTKNGTILVFDEIVTGFRIAIGGAQELFGVIPDLAIFAKGLSNGFPLSVLLGRAELMMYLNKVHASLTFGGETLSLAAAKATIEKYRHEPVIDNFRRRGQRILDETKKLLDANGLNEIFVFGGNPAWPFLLPKDGLGYSEPEIRTFFLQEMFAQRILVLGAHCLSHAMSDDDIERLLAVYGDVLPRMAAAIETRTLEKLLKTTPPKVSTTKWR